MRVLLGFDPRERSECDGKFIGHQHCVSGYHYYPFMCLNVYSGNNVISRYEGNTDGTAYQTSSNLSFNYAQDPTQQPATPNNIKAAIVNAFYIVNTIHDISYL